MSKIKKDETKLERAQRCLGELRGDRDFYDQPENAGTLTDRERALLDKQISRAEAIVAEEGPRP